MKGSELLRKIRKLAKERGESVAFEKNRGKGSHGTLHYGDKIAVIPNLKHELKTGTLKNILSTLGIDKEDV